MYLGGNRHWVPRLVTLRNFRSFASLVKLIQKPLPAVLFNKSYISKNVINLT